MMTAALTTDEELLLDSYEVASRPWRRFADTDGLHDRVLWQDPMGRSYAGLLGMSAGASLPAHVHHHATHHLWVVSGDCMINGRRLDSGSYVFVPAGVEHGIGRAGRAGCLLFYLYLVAPGAGPASDPIR